MDNIGKIYTDYRLGGVPRYYLGKPDDWDMKVIAEILKCTVFMGCQNGENFTPYGTGFFVGVPYKNSVSWQHDYLVTAKHLIDKDKAGCNSFRVNTRDGVSKSVFISKSQRWYDHPTEVADVYVTPIDVEDDWDMLVLPAGMIASKDIIGNDAWITTGSDVFITGFFEEFNHGLKNYPIVRKGSIAMLPKERIYSEGIGEIESYLIESRSRGGLSGSPVFWYASSDDLDMKKVYEKKGALVPSGIKPVIRQNYWGLLGLIQGHFDVKDKDKEDSDPEYDSELSYKKGVINAGIASVTPSIKIEDILNIPELVKQREEAEEEYRQRKGTTPD